MSTIFGSAFLPTPQEIENFSTKVKSLIPHQKITSEQHLKLIDTLYYIVQKAKTVLLKNELPKDEVIRNLTQIEGCPIWFDLDEISQIDDLEVEEICRLIGVWQDGQDNWAKAAKAITKEADKKISGQNFK